MMRDVLGLSKSIKKARVSAGLSQKELAEKLGVTDKTVSAYELGRAIPPTTTFKKIAEATKQPLDDFFDDQEEDELKLINEKLDIILKELRKLSK